MRIAHEVAMFDDSIAHSVKDTLTQRLGKERMDLWFGPAAKWQMNGHNEVSVQVASSFVAECVSKMFRLDLQSAVEEVAGPDVGFRIAVAEVAPADSATEPLDPSSPRNVSTTTVMQPIHSTLIEPTEFADDAAAASRFEGDARGVSPLKGTMAPKSGHHDSVVPAGTSLRVVRDEADRAKPEEVQVDRLLELRRENERRWDEFIPGEHNRLVHTAAQMVLEKPGQINPLLIYGPNGVGKSHLAIGLAHKMRQTHRMRRVLVLTGEQFTIEYTESARGGGFANFRRKYRDVEAIVIDDVQFCLGKSGTLVELRNTIDMLLRDRRQVILVADRGLNELSGLGADLYARLAGGMACGIDPMDTATRQRVLANLCQKRQVLVHDSTIKSLAAHCSGDARVLQGIVHRLVAQQRLSNGSLTDHDAIRCTMDLIRASQPIIRMSDIEKVVCDAFGLEDSILRAKSKCQSVSQPRMLAMFLARKYTRTALSEIGEYFGNRQHSTVISAQKKVEGWIDGNEVIGCGRGQVAVRDILKNLEATLQVG